MDFITDLSRAAIALFIIVDPFGNIPIFEGLTEKIPDDQKKKVYNTATIVGIALLLVFAFTGQVIFSFLGCIAEEVGFRCLPNSAPSQLTLCIS